MDPPLPKPPDIRRSLFNNEKKYIKYLLMTLHNGETKIQINTINPFKTCHFIKSIAPSSNISKIR